ncbi:protein asteroid homolog 1 [Bombina bombina]|uniref:protein asteroid homolog 1 n=1 Tax=Bombina bombina TaxID=8345 RepID=UPI00235ABAF3|nr:protein asteroid homolog 1 [Bombina bombina]
MGIQGLMSYVTSEKQFFSDLQLRNTKIIIDGNNLYHKLYLESGLDQKHGGDYDAFVEIVHKFFESLMLCGIHPYVALDGGCDVSCKKLETQKQRVAERIRMAHNLSKGGGGNVLPLLVREVFIQVLRNMQVPFVQCFSEADSEMVKLANLWYCPVLTFDSDFCIFDLKAGYCPLNSFQWKNIATSKGKQECYIPAKCFSAQLLCRYFNNMNMSLLPLFAVLSGNDYINLPALETFFSKVHLPIGTTCPGGRKHLRIYGLLNWLSAFADVEEAMGNVLKHLRVKIRDKVRDLLYSAMEEYNLSDTVNLDHFFQKGTYISPTALRLNLLDWIQHALARGQLSPFVSDALVLRRTFLHVQVEDSRKPSAHLVAKPIRQVIYGMLLNLFSNFENPTAKLPDRPVVIEFDRLETTLRKSNVEAFISMCFFKDLSLQKLREIPVETRLKLLIETLEVEENVLESVPSEHRLSVAVTRYWYSHANPKAKPHHLRALILGIVYGKVCNKMIKSDLQDDEIRSVYEQLQNIKQQSVLPQKPDLEDLHIFCQWQCCLQMGLYLNQLLGAPLPEPDLTRIYNGTLVHHLSKKLKTTSLAEDILQASPLLKKLYQDCTQTVLSVRPPDHSESRSGSTKSRKKKKASKGANNSTEQSVMENQPMCDVHNRFAGLLLDD